MSGSQALMASIAHGVAEGYSDQHILFYMYKSTGKISKVRTGENDQLINGMDRS